MASYDSSSFQTVPVGTVMAIPLNSGVPQGFLACDGSTLKASVYPELAQALMVQTELFEIPDLRPEEKMIRYA